jgi:LEA14-like dessication related protein
LLYSVGKLGVSVVNAKYLNYNIKSFDLVNSKISISIVNPTPSSYTLQSLNLDINDNDTRIASVNYMGQLIIMPNATTTLDLGFKIDPAGDLQTLLNVGTQLIKSDSTDAQTITAKGSAQIDTIMLPVSMTLGVAPPQNNVF